MVDVTPDPKTVRDLARRSLTNDIHRLMPSWFAQGAGSLIHSEDGPGGLSVEDFTAWHEAVVKQISTAQITVSWPDEPDMSGWSAEENAEFEKRYGVRAAMALRAANNRVWAIVQELRDDAVKAGRDPYQDPMAQRLSAALVGADDA